MQEQLKQQHIPVKVYRTDERLMVATLMPGLEPENIVVEVTVDGRLILHGDLRGILKEVKELLLDEWSAGIYHRELALATPSMLNAPTSPMAMVYSWSPFLLVNRHFLRASCSNASRRHTENEKVMLDTPQPVLMHDSKSVQQPAWRR